MSRVVLAPLASRDLFSTVPDAFAPFFYTYRATRPIERISRRLGWRRAARLRAAASPMDLAAVTAFWLDSSVLLSREETNDLLDRLPRLEWVYSQRTGYDHLPLDVYAARGIALSRGAGLTSRWVAEMNFACALSHAKRLAELQFLQRRHRARTLAVQDLREFTVLVIGTGAIGGHTARLCRGAGMRVVGASRTPERFGSEAHEFDELIQLDRALRRDIGNADAVILALPLAPETRGCVSAAVVDRMRPQAALINLSRPGVIDERAVIAALRSGRLGSAWVSQTRALGPLERWRARRLPNFHLTNLSEGHVASKIDRAFGQFVELAHAQASGEVRFRVA